MVQTKSSSSWAKQNRVSWSFWAYVNPYRPMTVIDYTTNQVDPGREARPGHRPATRPSSNAAPVASFTSTCTLLVVLVRRHRLDRSRRVGRGVRVDVRRRDDEHAPPTPDSHVRGGRDLLGDVDRHRQPRCHGRRRRPSVTVTQSVAVRVGRLLPDRGRTAGAPPTRVVRGRPAAARRAFARQRWDRQHHDATAGSGPSIFLNAVSSTNTDVAGHRDDRQGADRRRDVPVGHRASRRGRRRLPGEDPPAIDGPGRHLALAESRDRRRDGRHRPRRIVPV